MTTGFLHNIVRKKARRHAGNILKPRPPAPFEQAGDTHSPLDYRQDEEHPYQPSMALQQHGAPPPVTTIPSMSSPQHGKVATPTAQMTAGDPAPLKNAAAAGNPSPVVTPERGTLPDTSSTVRAVVSPVNASSESEPGGNDTVTGSMTERLPHTPPATPGESLTASPAARPQARRRAATPVAKVMNSGHSHSTQAVSGRQRQQTVTGNLEVPSADPILPLSTPQEGRPSTSRNTQAQATEPVQESLTHDALAMNNPPDKKPSVEITYPMGEQNNPDREDETSVHISSTPVKHPESQPYPSESVNGATGGTVEIHIGHINIHVPNTEPGGAKRSQPESRALSLDSFLAESGGV
ncbi:MAG: hypothetical protein ABW168_03460 [Sedimenticola sp.]